MYMSAGQVLELVLDDLAPSVALAVNKRQGERRGKR